MTTQATLFLLWTAGAFIIVSIMAYPEKRPLWRFIAATGLLSAAALVVAVIIGGAP